MPEIWKKVGKIKEPHALKGELYVLIFSKDISWFNQLTEFRLSSTDDPQAGKTFEVEKIKPFREGLMLKPKNISTRNESDLLKGQMFFIPESLLSSEVGETIFLSEIQGFEITDENNKRLATITGFSSNGLQDLLVVLTTEGQIAEIPFVQDFILDLNFEKKIIKMSLPEGLLDLGSSI